MAEGTAKLVFAVVALLGLAFFQYAFYPYPVTGVPNSDFYNRTAAFRNTGYTNATIQDQGLLGNILGTVFNIPFLGPILSFVGNTLGLMANLMTQINTSNYMDVAGGVAVLGLFFSIIIIIGVSGLLDFIHGLV